MRRLVDVHPTTLDHLRSLRCDRDDLHSVQGRHILWGWLQERRKVGSYDYAGCLSLPRIMYISGNRLHQVWQLHHPIAYHAHWCTERPSYLDEPTLAARTLSQKGRSQSCLCQPDLKTWADLNSSMKHLF